MNREEKLKICQQAYADIQERIWYWTCYHPEIRFYWNEWMGFDEVLFHSHELEKKEP